MSKMPKGALVNGVVKMDPQTATPLDTKSGHTSQPDDRQVIPSQTLRVAGARGSFTKRLQTSLEKRGQKGEQRGK